MKKVFYVALGFLFVALGIAGSLLPVMPGMIFFVLASVCFSKGSERFYRMLLSNRFVGPYIRDYQEGRGVPRKTKILLIVFQLAAVAVTGIFIVKALGGRIVLAVFAAAGLAFTLSLKSR